MTGNQNNNNNNTTKRDWDPITCPGSPGWEYTDNYNNTGYPRSSEEIRRLTRQMQELGYKVSSDQQFFYDEPLARAVQQFQAKAGGLKPDGIFGPKTCPVWNKHYKKQRSMRQATDTHFWNCNKIWLAITRDKNGNITSYPTTAYHLNVQMKDMGYTVIEPYHDYDTQTEANVIDFQTKHNLKPDGIFGPETCRAWRKYYTEYTWPNPDLNKTLNISQLNCKDISLKEGSSGNSVAILQMCMKELGWYNGRVDGMYGPVTTASVKKAQAELGHNLKVDGWFGTKTCPVFKQYYTAKKEAEKRAAQKKKDDEEARKKRLAALKAKKARLAKERRERNKKVNELVQAWAGVEGNVSFDGMKFVATSIESSTNIRGVNWQTVELMGDQNYTYKGHSQPIEYDVTVPLPWNMYYEIEQYLIQLCSAPKEVLCKEIQSGKYYISYTKSTGKGLMQHVKFHIVRK